MTTTQAMTFWLFGLVVGLIAGAALVTLWRRGRGASVQAELAAQQRASEHAEQRLAAAGETTLARQSEQLRTLVEPFEQAMRELRQRVDTADADRRAAYGALGEQVRSLAQHSDALRNQTHQLSAALTNPQLRGRWGEQHLRRVVEVAGMTEHVDFSTQAYFGGEDGAARPDLVVHLAAGKLVAVDAKAPLNAYLAAGQTDDDGERRRQLSAHARAVRGHIDALAAKAYWHRFVLAPEFVVLFLPADAFLDAALARDPELLEHAFSRDVVLATPSTLVALLRTVAFTWRSEQLAEGAAALQELGTTLHQRLATFSSHLGKVGSGLATAVNAYNQAVGSFEGRVLVSARRLAEAGAAGTSIEPPAQLDTTPRQVAG